MPDLSNSMTDELNTPNSQRDLPDLIAKTALAVAAGICLLTSIGLAIADKVAAGTLAAGLFVVCALLHYLPQMESFKAYGIEAKMRVRERAEDVLAAGTKLIKEVEEFKAKLPADAPKDALKALEKVDKRITQLSTANNALSATLTAIDLTTGLPKLGSPTLSTKPRATSPSE